MRTRPGFTLIELLVVISIIAVLAGILLPAIGLVRQQARVAKCRSNQKQIFLAVQCYSNDGEGRLPDVQLADQGTFPTYWMVLIKDYLEQAGNGTFQLTSFNSGNFFQSCPAVTKTSSGSAYALNSKLAYATGGSRNAQHNRWFGGTANWEPFTMSTISLPTDRAYLLDSTDPATPGGAMGFYTNADALVPDLNRMLRHRQKAVMTFLDGHNDLVDLGRLQRGLRAEP